MRPRLLLTATLALVASASTIRAQVAETSDQIAMEALLLTPVGALPHLVRSQRLVDSASFGEVAGRFARYSQGNPSLSFNNLGVTGTLFVRHRVELGATYGYRSCKGCEGLDMGGLDVATSVFHKPATGDIGGDTDIRLRVSAGYGKARSSDVSATSLAVGVPIAITLPQAENSLFTLFVEPALAYGTRTINNVSDGGSIYLIAAGANFTFDFGLGLHGEVHRVLMEGSPTQIGVAASWLLGRRQAGR